MKLVADIGGTKTLLGRVSGNGVRDVVGYLNVDYQSFEMVLGNYLQSLQPSKGSFSICLAIAGIISDDRQSARLTTYPWSFSRPALEALFPGSAFYFLNDFVAAAQGLSFIDPHRPRILQTGRPLLDSPRLVVGIGTGLGVAIVSGGGGDKVYASEAGHMKLAAMEDGFGIVAWLQAQLARPLCVQDIISGEGLRRIYAYQNNLPLDSTPLAKEISIAAHAGGVTERRACDLFFEWFGSIVGDLALFSLPRGGIYLSGGVVDKNLSLVQESRFLKAFHAKGLHQELMNNFPVYFANEPRLGLLGGAAYLQGKSVELLND